MKFYANTYKCIAEMETAIGIRVPKRKLASLYGDNVKSAEAVNLVYTTDKQAGITRQRKNKEFEYLVDGRAVTDDGLLRRIKGLVIPPAWESVWICKTDNGHLQATGIDTKHRKQYRYHPLWNALRNQAKFIHLYEFGKALPAIRQQLQKDLARHGLPLEKVLATVVSVMQCTCIRVGNSQYEQLYGSFGLTTLKDKHVSFSGPKVQFTFTGKKGVHHKIGLKSKRLANIVKQCRDIPGKELFQYYDDNGKHHPVDSGMVNDYIRGISGGSFTAKDFRTWAGTLHAIEAFKEMGCCDTLAGTKKNIVAALDTVARQLGNTRTVCKKYYVHPMVIDHYTNGTIAKYLDNKARSCDETTGLTASEQVLMRMLEDGGAAVIAA